LSPGFFAAFSAQAQTAQSLKTAAVSSTTGQAAHLQPVTASIPADVKAASVPAPHLVAAPGTEIYTAKRGETIPAIAHRYLAKTSYLTSSELADAIRAANQKGTANVLKANENIVIPGILSAPIAEKTIPVPKDFEVRAVYLTGFMAGSDHGLAVIRHWRQVGGNAVVFDIKDSDGSVTIPFEHPLLGKHNVYIHDVPKFVHFLHSENMHAIARIAIFRDERLVTEHPELAVQSRTTHQAWRENGKLVWTDPSQPKVQEYNIALAKYVAQLGVDEIQFDYVRFPAEGDQKDASFLFQRERPDAGAATAHAGTEASSAVSTAAGGSNDKDHAIPTTAPAVGGTLPQSASAPAQAGSQPAPQAAEKTGTKSAHHKPRRESRPVEAKQNGPQRADVIADFLKKAYAEIHPTGALFSLDVFGVMAWQRQIDLSHTGQDIVRMAQYCDVLSPMIYPSHFFGMDNIKHPGDAPEHFIGESMDRFMLITKGSGVVIRPWLQAFHWRTKTYSPEYIKVQVATAREKGGVGFLFWNAANDYSKPFVAMPEMRATNYQPDPKPAEASKEAEGSEGSTAPKAIDGAKASEAVAGSNAPKDGDTANSADTVRAANPAKASGAGTESDADKSDHGVRGSYRYFRGDELPAASVRASLTPAN
jgi:hypothetical protein